ncbi:MAG: 1-deoxy-D-xylulose-5-phosphate reductoisomerase [Candidatus Latescibacterota bacterium]
MKSIVVLGCTGSIGDTTFRVLEGLGPGYRVVGLSGGQQTGKLLARARQWRPQQVCVPSAGQRTLVEPELPGVRVRVGEEGLVELATVPGADLVVNGLVGAVGLRPTLAALEAGKVVAMANKEPLVMAGGLVLEAARRGGGTLLPLDSEPSALWQCLKGEDPASVRRLILTASGGPFRTWTRQQMAGIAPSEALAHPTWRMGPKITVDSATLMNKGFEVIEASWLFAVPVDRIEVVIHPESIVHSLVELADGAILAHLGRTDMVLPVQYALTHPARFPAPLEPLDLTQVGHLSFARPDHERFPCLDLCYRAARQGGGLPAALSAANEEAVAAFLGGRIGFLDIALLALQIVDVGAPAGAGTVEEVLSVDRWARQRAREWMARRR